MLLATLASTHAFAPVLPATARRATVVPQMAGNFFDNAAKNAANAAAKLVTGADQEENDLMEAKMKAGTIDFNDFLRQSEMMAKAAGVGQAITNVGINLPGGMDKKQMAQATKKLETFRTYIEVMTEEERATPDLFITRNADPAKAAAIEERVALLAEKAGAEVADVQKFVNEFSIMKSAAKRFAGGESEADIKRGMAEEQAAMGDPMSRAMRRRVDGGSGKKSKKKKASEGGGAGGFSKR